MDRNGRHNVQLRLPFGEMDDAEDPQDWPDPGDCQTELPVDEEGLPLHPVAVEMAGFLSRELLGEPLKNSPLQD